jgi:ribosomal protein S6--L-glutamate ligase
MKIAILTRLPKYYTEQRLLEEAEKRGHEVELLRYPAAYVSLSEEGSKILYKGEELGTYDVVIPRSFAGTSLYGTAILRQFEVKGAYALIKSIAVTRAIDGLRTMQLLAREGVPVPRTVFTREPDQADELIEQVGLPAVIKIASTLRRGNTVLVETRKAMASVIRAFYVNDATFLLQEYVHSDDSQSIRAVVVGSTVAASVAKSDAAFTASNGEDLANQYTKIAILTDEQKKVAVKAAKAVGLTVCTVDMIISKDRTVVLSLSPYFGLENVERVTKRNIAGKIIEYIERNAKRNNKKDKVGA